MGSEVIADKLWGIAKGLDSQGTGTEECARDGRSIYSIEHPSAKLVRLQAIVNKLPKYKDTDEPFVPGVDEAWSYLDNGEPLNYDYDTRTKHLVYTDDEGYGWIQMHYLEPNWPHPSTRKQYVYSTAEAAKEAYRAQVL